MSGGAHYVEYAVDVRAVPTPQAAALDELYEAKLLEEVEVPLYGPHRSAQGLCQGFHLGPAQAGLVVGVVGEGAVGGDRLCRDSGLYEVTHLGYACKLGLRWHDRLLFVVRRCASMIEFIKEAAGIRLRSPRRFFYALVREVA